MTKKKRQKRKVARYTITTHVIDHRTGVVTFIFFGHRHGEAAAVAYRKSLELYGERVRSMVENDDGTFLYQVLPSKPSRRPKKKAVKK